MLSNPPRRARPEPIINRLAVLACQQPKEPAPADGYSKNWARQLMELAAEVSGWLGEAGLGAGDLTGEVMGEFFARRGPGCSRCRTARSLGVAAAEVVPGPSLRCTATALRSFLRFLPATGRIASSLVDAVPALKTWPCTVLPSAARPAKPGDSWPVAIRRAQGAAETPRSCSCCCGSVCVPARSLVSGCLRWVLGFGGSGLVLVQVSSARTMAAASTRAASLA